MIAIFKKEINAFFATPIGYLVIALFLILNGLFLWVFKSDFNILHAGFADLSSFFYLAPYIFIFLIPAITMQSFSDEMLQGTIEILKTKPLTHWQIIFGKYLAALTLVFMAIIPTLIYVFSISKLGKTPANFDLGSLLGSYIGLLFLASAYTAIGIFCSTFSKNQIVAFMLAAFITYFMFQGWQALGNFNLFGNLDLTIQKIGIQEHYNSMSLGVIDTRDVVYFISLTSLFLILTKFKFQYES